MACRVYGYTPISVPAQNDTIKVNNDSTVLSTKENPQKIRFFEDAKPQLDSITKNRIEELEKQIQLENEKLDGKTPEQWIKQYYKDEYKKMIKEDIRSAF